MSVLQDVLDAVIDMAESTSPYSIITVGALPPPNSIVMTYAAGAPDTTFLDRGAAYSMTLVCNGKHTDQRTALDALAAIHERLTQATDYPVSDAWQITTITTASAPTFIEQQLSDGQFLYGSSLTVYFYCRRATDGN